LKHRNEREISIFWLILENIDKIFFDIPYVDVSQHSRLPKKEADIGKITNRRIL